MNTTTLKYLDLQADPRHNRPRVSKYHDYDHVKSECLRRLGRQPGSPLR